MRSPETVWGAHSPSFPSSFRMVLRVWLCDPKLHQHLAVPDRGSTRVPDDARQRANVSEQTTGFVEWVSEQVFQAGGLVVLFSGQPRLKIRVESIQGYPSLQVTDFCHVKKTV